MYYTNGNIGGIRVEVTPPEDIGSLGTHPLTIVDNSGKKPLGGTSSTHQYDASGITTHSFKSANGRYNITLVEKVLTVNGERYTLENPTDAIRIVDDRVEITQVTALPDVVREFRDVDESATEATLTKPHSPAFRLVSQIPTAGKTDLQEFRRQLLARSRTEGGAAPAENVLENQARVRLSDDAHTVLVESGAIQQMWDVTTGKLKEFSEWGGSGGQMGFVPRQLSGLFRQRWRWLMGLKDARTTGKVDPARRRSG